MVWAAFSWHGVGPIHRINGIMTKEMYKDILENVMSPYADDNMPLHWIFQHDNDPKHTAAVVRNWLDREKIAVLDWPAQSPDLNPIENLWKYVKDRVYAKKPTNKNELWLAVKDAWESVPISLCRRLVESLPKRCDDVLKNKGFTIDY